MRGPGAQRRGVRGRRHAGDPSTDDYITTPRAWTAYKRTGRVNRAQAGSQWRGPGSSPDSNPLHSRLGAGLSANTPCARAIALKVAAIRANHGARKREFQTALRAGAAERFDSS